MVELRDLHVKFNDSTREAVAGIDLVIHDGEVLGLVGESGSGKTVTAMTLSGLIERKKVTCRGQVLLDGEDLLPRSRQELRTLQGSEIGVVFQEPMTAMDPLMRIGPQVEEALAVHTKLTKEERRERALQALADVDLPDPEDIYHKYPHECSGGMLQRVMIAIAILMDPAILIADEPTTAVDVTVQRQVIAMLRRLNQEQHTGILYISHDLRIVEDLAQRIYVMYAGALVESFPAQVLREGGAAHPYTRRLLASRPSFTKEKLPVMPGSPPALMERPAGCPFAPRCSEATAACADFGMERTDLGGGHWLRCCRAGGGV